MKEEVDVVGSPSLIVRTVSVDEKQHCTNSPISVSLTRLNTSISTIDLMDRLKEPSYQPQSWLSGYE